MTRLGSMTRQGSTLGRVSVARSIRRRASLVTLTSAVALMLAGTAPAHATEALTPWWRVGAEVTPSNLPPEHEGEKGREGQGAIVLAANDLGAGPATGTSSEPIVVSDSLPAGLKATAITALGDHATASCSLAPLQCAFRGSLYPYERLEVRIKVKVEEPPGTVTTLPDEMTVQGGGAPQGASSTQQVTISGTPTPFGVQTSGYELAPYNQDGTPATDAGSHPFQLTSTLVMNQVGEPGGREPVALPRNLGFRLPLGLIGDPQATEHCSMTDFTSHAPVSEVDECPPGSVVGVASVTIDEPQALKVKTLTVPLFNLVPSQGEPARFGFEAFGLVPVIIDTSVSPSGDYAVVASVENATAIAGLLSSQVTIWGVPGDPRHDQARGWECIEGGTHVEKGEIAPCSSSTSLPETPLLTLPTSCSTDPATEPVSSSLEADSWSEPGYVKPSAFVWSGALGESLGFTGCSVLPFEPSIGVAPEAAHASVVHSASTATGLTATVRMPQTPTTEANPEGRAEADVRDTTVTLPAGVQLNPSAANGLEACPEHLQDGIEGVGFEGFEKFVGTEGAPAEPAAETAVFSSTFRFTAETVEGRELLPSCPDASKVGVVHIKTPLLPNELEGAVYLAEPAPNGEPRRNPFNSLIALYVVAEDKEAGVLVKLAGEGHLDQATGLVSTTFRDTPQVPFEELRLELFGGQRASLSTPAVCGAYSTLAELTPWSSPPGSSPIDRSSSGEEFDISENCSPGTPLAFSPAFYAQSTSTQASGFTSFSLQLERADGQQALSGLSVHLPPGVSALLSSLTPCQEPPPGQAWTCGAESRIGQSLASSGVGSEPVTLPGNVYLTGGYEGAPFGVLDETEAKAGPFNLGKVYVRSKIEVNPETAAVTITTAPGPHGDNLPTILKGVPVDLKRLTVEVDRPNFELNPTSCAAMSITGTLEGSEGASSAVSSPFQVGGCQSLPFAPGFSASVTGQASKADGTTFKVKMTSPGLGQANIQKVDLQLPKQLPSRLPTLQKACVASVFEANPAECDEGSIIGTAIIHTPVLKSPLIGPAYLVSHGNSGFPDVEFVLQGEGIKLVLDGKTDIKNGITYSKFETAPDAPFTTFETVLPAGPHGVLTADVAESKHFDLCGENLQMPTKITAQDGTVIEHDTKIAVQGCGAVKASKVKKLTRAQLLDKALQACRKRYTRNKHYRQRCVRRARKRYTTNKKKTTHNQHHG